MVDPWEDLYPDPEVFRPDRVLDRQFSPYEFVVIIQGSTGE
ncbi:hypothetical protein [Prochlorothrix hollandica]|nr:hypothetical protein [Prochlorothrix hollandica]